MTTKTDAKLLAIDGGPQVRTAPWPGRVLFGEDEKQAAMRVFDEAIAAGSTFGYGGGHCKAYEEAFSSYLGGGFTRSVNSGTNALWVALRSLDLEPFTEVIVPPVTDPGGMMPVPMQNCIPVPADAAPDSYNASPETIEACINERTSAIIVAHIAGIPVDLDPIMALAKKHNLYVIEDCAQAHGATYKGRMVGSVGHVSAFSTMFGKHHASGGQGGLVFTKDERIALRVKQAADRGKPCGQADANGNVFASLNNNMDDLHAAIGLVNLAKLPEAVKKRRAYVQAVKQGTSDLKSVAVVSDPPFGEASYWFMFVKLNLSRLSVDKDTFVAALQAEGVPAQTTYLVLPSEMDWFRNQAIFGSSGYPWAAPQYAGPKHPTYALPNIRKTDVSWFRTNVSEFQTLADAEDFAAALRKVEAAYLK